MRIVRRVHYPHILAGRLLHRITTLILIAVTGVLSIGAAERGDCAEKPSVPNIVLILADDLGWADLACYGNGFNETPHLDRLAAEGLRFTQFYAGPVCSPTRANLQAGQNQARLGITVHIPGHWRPFEKMVEPPVALHLPLEVQTFAERLRAAGYQTGYFGKWHLGGAGYGPGQQGWQRVLEMQGNTVPRSIDPADPPRRAADYLAERAIEFIEAHRNEPFLLQVSHYAVHIPLTTTPQLRAKYERKPPAKGYPSRPDYAGLLEELDRSVGQVVQAIDRLGLADRTLVLFISDNGGLEHQQSGEVVTSNQPLRGEKGTLYEGGIRVPCIARWPGAIPSGKTADTIASTIDIYPTLLELAGVAAVDDQVLDGVSLAPVLRDAAKLPRETLYWHLPHYHHSRPSGAIRQADWKLIEYFEDGALELYNLSKDLGEQQNLAGRHPDVARRLRGELASWRKEVQAQMPRPNPAYDPARAGEFWSRRDVAPTRAPGSRRKARETKEATNPKGTSS